MFRRRVSEDKAKPGASVPGGDQGAGPAEADGLEPGSAGRNPYPPGRDADEAGRDCGEAGVSPPAGLDVSMPHPARVWNCWLGGRDYFAADLAAAEEIGREFPHLAEIARAERAFLVRAVRFLAGPARIRQFLDIGAGLPAGGNTHEIAQRIAPDTGIVYADNDPVVAQHAKALLDSPMLASSPEGVVSYLDADLRDVAAILAGAASTLDTGKPVALIMLGILGHVDDYGAARSITSQLMAALPSGSYLAIADGMAATGTIVSAQARYTASIRQWYRQSPPAPYLLRRPDELVSFFDGLDLVEPGVVPCPRWKPDVHGTGSAPPAEAAVYCGVARKP